MFGGSGRDIVGRIEDGEKRKDEGDDDEKEKENEMK